MNGLRATRFARFLPAVIAAAVWGCAQTQSSQQQRPAMLQTASTNVLTGNYDEAVTIYTDFLGTGPAPQLMAEGYVGRGNAYYKLGRYELAEADFRAGLSIQCDRATRAQATLGLANSVFALENYEGAEKVYRQIPRLYQGLVPQDEVTYRLGLSLARQGKWDEVRQLLEQVAADWPGGDFARSAKAKLAAVNGRVFTVQVGAFTNKTVAEKALGELKAQNFPAALEPIDIGGVPGYAIRSGRFTDWKAVSDHAEKLKAAGFPVYKLP